MSHLAQSIQVVLVFDNAIEFDRHFADLSQLGGRLQVALQSFGPWQSLAGYNTPNNLGFASENRHITLQRYDQPMPLNGFADVLANPLIVNGKPALTKAISEHQRAFLLEVGSGSVPGFNSALAQSGIADALGGMEDLGMGLTETQDGYEARLLLAQAFAVTMLKEMTPSVVHWVQSQQLFDAHSFAGLATEGFALPLYCGPFLYGEQRPDGSVKAGVRALGSQNVLGKMVIFKPDTQDWSESYMQILAFVAYCRSIGRILDDGETMSSDAEDSAVLRVTHKTDIPQLPEGYIELSVDGRQPCEVMTGKVYRADEAKMTAAMQGTHNALSAQKPQRGGILGRLFGR